MSHYSSSSYLRGPRKPIGEGQTLLHQSALARHTSDALLEPLEAFAEHGHGRRLTGAGQDARHLLPRELLVDAKGEQVLLLGRELSPQLLELVRLPVELNRR